MLPKKSKYNVLKCMFGCLLNWWNSKSDVFDAAYFICISFYAKNTCQGLNWVVYEICDILTLHIFFSCLSGSGSLAAPDLGHATFTIIAISSDQSYFSWKFIFWLWYRVLFAVVHTGSVWSFPPKG